MRLTFLLIIALATSSCVFKQRAGLTSSGLAGPALAQQEAESFLAHLSSEPTSSEREDFRHDFTNRFFSGFTSPNDCIIGSDAAEHGFKAGQKFRRHCNERDITRTMEAYGYVAAEAIGTWNVRFEVSCFCPRNTPDEAWWLSGFGNTKYILPKKGEKIDPPVLYRISGFLSPKGEYGHLGNSSHEFYATKVVYIKDGRKP